MLPIRHKSIFKSRWTALLWAGGVIWTAVDYVGHPSATASAGGNTANTTSAADASDGTGPVSNQDLAAAQTVVNEMEGIQ